MAARTKRARPTASQATHCGSILTRSRIPPGPADNSGWSTAVDSWPVSTSAFKDLASSADVACGPRPLDHYAIATILISRGCCQGAAHSEWHPAELVGAETPCCS